MIDLRASLPALYNDHTWFNYCLFTIICMYVQLPFIVYRPSQYAMYVLYPHYFLHCRYCMKAATKAMLHAKNNGG